MGLNRIDGECFHSWVMLQSDTESGKPWFLPDYKWLGREVEETWAKLGGGMSVMHTVPSQSQVNIHVLL